MNLRQTLATTIALLALTACTSSETPTATKTITVEAPEPTPASDDMTTLIVDITWQQQTEDDKDAMCLGIGVYGPEWAAEQMAADAGDDSIDWQRAAELVAEKCADR